MALSDIVRDYLNKCGFPYRIVSHPPAETLEQIADELELPAERLVRVVLLRDEKGVIMALLPTRHIVDFSTLQHTLERGLEPLYGEEANRLFEGCEPGSHPPLPDLFKLPALAEKTLAESGEIYFEGGSRDELVCMASEHFRSLLNGVQWLHFAPSLEALAQEPATSAEQIFDVTSRYTPPRLKEGIEAFKDLSGLPEIVLKGLDLRNKTNIQAEDLVAIAESNAELAAGILSWARSPFFGPQEVASVRDAICKVLGLSNTVSLLLSTAMIHTFRIPMDGPLGMHAFWRHSIYCANLVRELTKSLPNNLWPHPELAYFAGLIHNFGYLVLGHLFPARYFLLNRFLDVNAYTPQRQAERHVLGVEHTRIGGWLMRAWQMPPQLIAAVELHHREDYSHPYAEYPNLILIANRLLRRIDIGDEDSEQLPAGVTSSLGLSEQQATSALNRLLMRSNRLDELSEQL